MIKTEHEKLIIILSHPCPSDALKYLQMGIIESLKYQYANHREFSQTSRELIEGNHLLLELLEATLEQESPKNTDQ